MQDLHRPSQALLRKTRPPLTERHRVAFCKGIAALLALVALLFACFGT